MFPPIDEVNPPLFLEGKLKSNKLYFIINIIEINFPWKKGAYKYESIYMRGNKCKLRYIEDTSTSSVSCFLLNVMFLCSVMFFLLSVLLFLLSILLFVTLYPILLSVLLFVINDRLFLIIALFFYSVFFPFGNNLVLIYTAPIFPGIYRFRRREA